MKKNPSKDRRDRRSKELQLTNVLQAKNKKIDALEEKIRTLQSEVERRDTEPERVKELESQLSIKSGELSELMSYSRQLIRELYFPFDRSLKDTVGVVPIESPHAAMIDRAEGFRDSLTTRDFIYVPRQFWYLHMGRITGEIHDLVISGLPLDYLENLSSLKCRITIITYDEHVGKVPKEVVIKTPQQYLREITQEDDPIYTRLEILTQIIDGLDVKAPENIRKDAKLIGDVLKYLSRLDVSSYVDLHAGLEELGSELRKYGTVKNSSIIRQLEELYESQNTQF
jgi:hypothetical protein